MSRGTPTVLDITKLMKGLASDRPVFHKEADFQLALARRIRAECWDPCVRLEHPVEWTGPRKRIYVDLYLPSSKVAVELKYRTQALQSNCKGECFDLCYQSAHDTGRYDFLKDVQRLERLSELPDVQTGLAVLITNDPLYWGEPSPDWQETNDAQFRLHEGRTIKGKMEWSKRAGAGTTKGRRSPIVLTGSYCLQWQDYADVGDGRYRRFRYLAIQIGGPSTVEEPRTRC